jgi:hypothetical protein
MQLPSSFSANTCYSAAIEICTIIRKTLGQRGPEYPGTPQLGLCAFVSARSLLCEFQCSFGLEAIADTLAQYTGDPVGSRSRPNFGSWRTVSTTWQNAPYLSR